MSAHDALDHDQSGLLSDATLAALQLRYQPFASDPNDAVLSDPVEDDGANPPFSDAITEEQLADIKQAVITGDDLLLILGEKGAGKTTLLKQLNANSGLRIQCFAVSGSERFSTVNLFSGILEAFQVKPPEKLKDILDELIPCLQTMVARNTLSAIVLDDADKVSTTELTQLLSGMLYMNSQDETLTRVALAAPADFEDLIPDLLPEGADLPYSSLTIEGFSPGRAAAYLDHRLTLAGFDQEFPFTDRDMASLVDHSGGRPAELHALTADVLNEKYGKLEASMPRELMSEQGPGFLQSRMGKLALGALATLFIIGGLLMFMPASEAPDPAPQPERPDVAESAEPSSPQIPQSTMNDSNPSQAPAESESPIATGQTTNSPLITPDNTDATSTSAASSGTSETSSSGQGTATDTELTAADPATAIDPDSQPVDEAPVSDTSNSEAVDTASTGNVAGSNDTAASAETDGQTTASSESDPTSSPAASSTATASTNEPTEVEAAAAAPLQQAELPDQPSTETTETTESTESASTASVAESTEPASVAESTEPASVVASVDAELETLLESPSWILVQDESLFTIQMSASRDLASVENFLRRNPLSSPNSIFSFEREGDVWYALVHGIFPTISEAQRFVEQMPADAQRDQPWIRSIARLKQILRQP